MRARINRAVALSAAVVVTVSLVATACAASSDVQTSVTNNETAAVSDAAQATPTPVVAATQPPTEAPPATPTAMPTPPPAPTATAVPAPTVEPLAVSSAEFCDASWDVAEALAVGDYLDDNAGAETVRAWAEEVSFRAEAAILLAPNAELAEAPNLFWEAWERLRSAFPPDGTFADFQNSSDAEALATVAPIIELLEDYLVTNCGVAVDELEGNAEGLAAQFVALAPPAFTGASADVFDEVSEIWVTVPATWTDREAQAGSERWLTIAEDLDEYTTTWNVAGMTIWAGDVSPGTANAADRGNSLPAWTDCVFVSSEPYADALYAGTLSVFEACGATDTAAAVLTATTDDESVEILVDIQVPSGQLVAQDVFNLILNSFVI